jgi:hypothetical protein
MSFPVQRGRLDLLLLALAEQACREHLDPRLAVPVWERFGAQLVNGAIEEVGIPTQPIRGVRLGNLKIPLEVLEYFGECCGVLPKRLGQ